MTSASTASARATRPNAACGICRAPSVVCGPSISPQIKPGPLLASSERQNEDVSNAESNRELAALKRMFNLALQQTPPKPYIPMLQECNVKKGFFEHEEFAALRAAVLLEPQPIVTFACYTG